MSATDFLRLSYYGFTAASIAVVVAVAFYVTDVLRLARSPRLATAAGPLEPWRSYATPPTGSGRLASTAAGIATLFAGLAVAFRVVATGRGPYSDMYEFSVAFVFAALLGYMLLERRYGVRPI